MLSWKEKVEIDIHNHELQYWEEKLEAAVYESSYWKLKYDNLLKGSD